MKEGVVFCAQAAGGSESDAGVHGGGVGGILIRPLSLHPSPKHVLYPPPWPGAGIN